MPIHPSSYPRHPPAGVSARHGNGSSSSSSTIGLSGVHSSALASSSSNSSSTKPQRVDTLDLKAKLTRALGSQSAQYWQGLRDFYNGRLTRAEFEEHAHMLLKPDQVHLHNALLLGLLYNSSPGVPGPSSSALGSAKSNARKAAAGGRGAAGLDDEDGEGPRKRVRLLVSGLNRKERLRLKTLGKAGKGGLLGAAAHANAGGAHGGNSNSAASASANGNGAAAAGAAASAAAAGGAGGLGEKSSSSNNLDWAGAGADILEKKRKDEERRRTVEEKKRYREAHTAIGAKAWKPELLKQTEAIEFARGKLATSVQQALSRGQSNPLCVRAKELPTVDSLRDRMTLHAIQNGLNGGVHPQAAAMLLTALQAHLQNVAIETIAKIRSSETEASNLSSESDRDAGAMRRSPAPMDVDRSDSPSASGPGPVSRLSATDGSPSRGGAAAAAAALAPEMSFRTGYGGGSSMGDTSMISLVSTAPTSYAPGSADTSAMGMDLERATVSDRASVPPESSAAQSHHQPRRRPSTLRLADVAFALQLAPGTVIEPVGHDVQERLLAPEWEDASAERETRSAAELGLIRVSRETTVSKLRAVPNGVTPEQLASEVVTTPARGRFVVDQSAPMRILDRRQLAETLAMESAKYRGGEGDRPTMGGLTVPGSAAPGTTAAAGQPDPTAKADGDKAAEETAPGTKRKEARLPNAWEVVDPIALLANI